MSGGWLALVHELRHELAQRTIEHLHLTAVAVAIAVAGGLPLGLWVTRRVRVRGPVLGLVGMVQTIPSLALLGLLLPWLGIGERPAIVALALYALLPIVRNTFTGLDGVPDSLIEAADGVGFTARQRLLMVELPLALPVLVAGIRTATVIGVGVATLAAFIGGGGLGEFIFRGIQSSNNDLMMVGAVPAAVLALVLDFTIGRVELALRRGPGGRPSLVRAAAWAVAPLVVILVPASLLAGRTEPPASVRTIAIGGKAFAEQRIVGEMMAQLIEDRTGLTVERKFDLGSTQIVHAALAQGEIDLYAEYTGTALMEILKHELMTDPAEVFALVARDYRRRFECEWLPAFGFNNTYTITVRDDEAARRGWRTIGDLAGSAPELTAGFTGEFIERPDGYGAFPRVYGFRFGDVRMMDPGLMYQAVAKGKVDVICGFGTDGRIPALHLRPLTDDRHLFPPYYAAPVVRLDTLRAAPGIREALAPLAGRIDDATMQRLNYAVDEEHRRARDVARDYLMDEGLLSPDQPSGQGA